MAESKSKRKNGKKRAPQRKAPPKAPTKAEIQEAEQEVKKNKKMTYLGLISVAVMLVGILVGQFCGQIGAFVGYPIAYQHQKLYLNVLAEAPICEDFAGIISGYLGKNWGVLLGILYFVFTTILIFLYSTALTNDSASFLVTFGVTETPLSENMFYGLSIITFLVLVASQGEKLLMKVSSGMVFTKAMVIAALGIIMFPHWDMANILIPSDAIYVIKHFIILLPFIAMSIEFFCWTGIGCHLFSRPHRK